MKQINRKSGFILEAKKTLSAFFTTGFFHVFGSSVINKIIAFLSGAILVRILSKSEYGVFTYAWNIYSIIVLFNGMGVESGVLQLASEHSGETNYLKKCSNYGTRFGLKFNCILTVFLLCIGLFSPLKIEGGRVLLCSLCLLPSSTFIFNMMIIYLRSQKKNKEYAILSVVNTLLVFVFSAGFAFIIREMGLVLGHYFASVVSCFLGFIAFRIGLINRVDSDIKSDKGILLRIAFISMINNGLSQLLYLLDVFVLGIVDPQETILASYKVATMIPTALTFIPASLVIYVYPYFAEHKNDGKWALKRYKQILIGLGSFNLILSSLLFILAPYIIRIIFGEQYLDSVPVFRLLAVNYFISGTFRTVSGNLLVTQRKLKFNLFVAVISSFTNIVADYFFIQWWGSMGAALATLLVVIISSVINTSYLIYSFNKLNTALL